MTSKSNETAVIRGKINKENGKVFERLVEKALKTYATRHIAVINKSPEPMKILRPMGQGQFLTCFASKAQPDYCGTVMGGRAIVFECKHTDTGQIKREAVRPWQAEALQENAEMGAICFVLVSFGLERFFKIPWDVWDGMKDQFGKTYATVDDLAPYECEVKNGNIDFLMML